MTNDPFAQVRQAHRICAAYYQQIFPLLSKVARRMNLKFIFWDTLHFEKPAKKRANPLELSGWDCLPMMDASFVFVEEEKQKGPIKKTDFMLDLRLITDSELRYEQFGKSYDEEEDPTAIKLKSPVSESETLLNVYIFSSVRKLASYNSFEEMWDNYEGHPTTDSTVCFNKDGSIKGIGFSIPIKDIANDGSVDVLVERIKRNRQTLMT